MNIKIISVDVKANWGCLKKPDINESIYLTFNMLHKPAFLGILGAIIGLDGYRESGKLPQYYQELKDLKIGIQPLNSENGNYPKIVIQYTNGVGYASREEGGILIVKEQTLIKPTFRCFISLENHSYAECIGEYLRAGFAEFLPYLGKNEYSLWWDNFQEYEAAPFQFDEDYKISTIFMKSEHIIREMVQQQPLSLAMIAGAPRFIYFEELPVGFDEKLMQYERKSFVYTSFILHKELKLDGLYKLRGHDGIVQLF